MRHFEFRVESDSAGARLDVFLSRTGEGISRAFAQKLIESGGARVNGAVARRSLRLRSGDRIELTVPDPQPLEVRAEDVPLRVVYEDAWMVVIDKPAGMVVHPAPGHAGGTLVNALLHHCRDLAGIGGVERPGIVHRLDKDTSGLLVVAKSDAALRSLAAQFKGREVEKTYLAIVRGRVAGARGKITDAIGRHRVQRKKMSVAPGRGREAETDYEVVERFGARASFLRLTPKTGRTHQLRVHLASIGHPILGDALYGGRVAAEQFGGAVIQRQALHAHRLVIAHPAEAGRMMEFVAPLPEDMERCLAQLRATGSDK